MSNIKGQHSQVTQEQYDSFQARHERNKALDAQKVSGLTEINLSNKPVKEISDYEEQLLANYKREKEMRPADWQSSGASQARNEAVKDAQRRKEERETELYKMHKMRSPIQLLWEQHLDEMSPNIYLVVDKEFGLEGKEYSGPFTNRVYLQQWLDIHSQDVYKAILTDLNALKKLTDSQKELTRSLQELIILTK